MKACLMQISSMPQASKPVKVEMYPIFAGYEPNHKCANGTLDGKNTDFQQLTVSILDRVLGPWFPRL